MTTWSYVTEDHTLTAEQMQQAVATPPTAGSMVRSGLLTDPDRGRDGRVLPARPAQAEAEAEAEATVSD